MNDDVRRSLEEAGRREVPEPRAGFAPSLQAHLQAMAAETRSAGEPPPAPRPRDRRWSPAGMVAGLTAVVVLVVAIAVLGGVDQSTRELELAEPVNVLVVLTDGTTLRDPDGLLLPDGAVIRVGAGGSARIGDSVLAAGDSATVDDSHRLRIDRQARSALTSPERTSVPTHPRTNPPTPAPTRSPAPTPRPSATNSAGGRTPAPTSTPRPTRTPTITPTAPPATNPGTTPPIEVKPPKLGARAVGPSEIQALWTKVPGARRYILIATRSRHGPAADPTYPGSWVIGRFVRRPAEPITITVNEAVVEVRLQVIVLGPGGVELTRSKIVTVSLRP
jgi:hypothetical protein